MGEYPGYLVMMVAKPTPNASAVTHRNQAILPIVVARPPVEEDHPGWEMSRATMRLRDLRAAGPPVTTA
jgi:3-polyprenyl-4-hydroxybenzoate decarboxylase